MGDFVVGVGNKFFIPRIAVGGPPNPTWADFEQTDTTWYDVSPNTSPQSIAWITGTRIDDNHALIAYHGSNFGDLRVAVINVPTAGTPITVVDEVDVTQSIFGRRVQLALSPIGNTGQYLLTGQSFVAISGQSRVRALVLTADSSSVSVGNFFDLADTPNGGTSFATMLDDTFGIQVYQLNVGGSTSQVPYANCFELTGNPISGSIIRMNAERLSSNSFQFTGPSQPPIPLNSRSALIPLRDTVSGGIDPVFAGYAVVRINDDGTRNFDTIREVLNKNVSFFEGTVLNTQAGSPEIYHLGGLGRETSPAELNPTHNQLTNQIASVSTTTTLDFPAFDLLTTAIPSGIFSPDSEDWTMVSVTVDTNTSVTPLRVGIWEFDPTTKVPSLSKVQTVNDSNGGSFRLQGGSSSTTELIEMSQGRLLVLSQCDEGGSSQSDNFVGATLLTV